MWTFPVIIFVQQVGLGGQEQEYFKKMTEFKIEPREHKIRVYLSVLLIFVVCAFGLAVCLIQYPIPKPLKKGKD